MRSTLFVAYKNITGRVSRSMTLIIIALILALTLFGGTTIVMALNNGFDSLERRLGADIMVVPYEAITKADLDGIILQGNTGYFYMDGDYLDKIAKMDGIGRISPQYYLASVKSGCCSMPIQIIGIDPETDFSVTPWIKKSDGTKLGYLDVIVGNDLNAFVGDTLSFYGVKVNVIAKLDKTGTSFDTEVFTNDETIKTLIDASLSKQLNEYANINSGNVISCIMIDVADGYDVEDVMGQINLYNKGVRAVRTSNMITGISDSLSAVKSIATILIGVVWLVALVVMIVAFIMMTGERKKEFAVFRVVGASRQMISRVVLIEGMMVTIIGSLIGVIIGAIIIIPFSGYIESTMSLPFLLPSAAWIILYALMAILLSMISGGVASIISAGRISRIDTGTILRSGE